MIHICIVQIRSGYIEGFRFQPDFSGNRNFRKSIGSMCKIMLYIKKTKSTNLLQDLSISGTPKGIRTPGLSVRSRTLYPLSYGRLSQIAINMILHIVDFVKCFFCNNRKLPPKQMPLSGLNHILSELLYYFLFQP